MQEQPIYRSKRQIDLFFLTDNRRLELIFHPHRGIQGTERMGLKMNQGLFSELFRLMFQVLG